MLRPLDATSLTYYHTVVPEYHKVLAKKAITTSRHGLPADVLREYLAVALHISSLTPRANTLHGVLSLHLGEGPEFAYDVLHDMNAGSSNSSEYLDPSLLIDTEGECDRSSSHGIYLLLVEDDLQFYVGKTRRSFRQRWQEHLTCGVNHKVRALMEAGKWSITKHVLLDFMLVPAEYRTATLLAGLEVIMNVMLGATIGDKGLNVNVVDIGPLAVSKVPEAGVIALYDAVLSHLETGRSLPSGKDYDAWEDLLGHAALYLQECYELSMSYIVHICRGWALKSIFVRHNMEAEMAKYTGQYYCKKATTSTSGSPEPTSTSISTSRQMKKPDPPSFAAFGLTQKAPARRRTE